MKPFNIFDFPFLKSLLECPHHEISQNGHNRHSKKHAEHSGNASADRDRHDNPERPQSHGLSQNLGSKIQSIKLLKREDHNNEDHRFQRTDHQHNNRSRNGSDEGTEIGNHIRDTNNQADQ